jgi:hypothetical protein
MILNKGRTIWLAAPVLLAVVVGAWFFLMRSRITDQDIEDTENEEQEGVVANDPKSQELERIAKELAGLKTEELIDRLTDVGSEGIGSHSTAWAAGFLALDEEPEFRGGVLGSKKPEVSPTMRELVRRGVRALPDLIKHLEDARSTSVVVGPQGPFGGTWHSDEYDSRSRDPKKCPQGVNTRRQVDVRAYTLRVGDLCYVAIGQIVNRNLSALRYQPTACLVINSPVENSKLADAVRKDWSGLTADAHRQSLTQDAFDPSPFAAPAALKRLWFYYPQAGEELARKLLACPLYGDEAVWDFVMKRLVKEHDPVNWDVLIDAYKSEEGLAAVEALPFWIHWIYWETSLVTDKEFLAGKDVAAQILAKRFPSYDPFNPQFVNAMHPRQAGDLVRGVRCIRTEAIDKAVYELFRRATEFNATRDKDRLEFDSLAVTCMIRLAKKGYDDEFHAFCIRRIKEIESTPWSSAQRRGLNQLRIRLKRLRAPVDNLGPAP